MKKYIFVVIMVVFNLPVLYAQITSKKGYAVYHLFNNYNNETIDFWFSADTYIYNVRRKDFRASNDYKSRIITLSKQDSLNFEKVIDTINKKNQALPPRYIYGNLRTNFTLQNELNANLQPVCVIDTLHFITWQVLPDTLTINGLLCRKAKGNFAGMEYDAWFAPSIPVAVAPLQLRGLPGLLVKLNNLTTHTQVVMTYFEWPAKQWVKATPCNAATAIGRTAFNEQNKMRQAQHMKNIKSAKTMSDLLNSIHNK
ncbi:MAG: GLPGLI family protein [Hydrotalea flava]|uniref:GLPGLI family protein n=1 Tax=Hydrotalea lipotrueae TaxID=2803817 RepID=UPI001693B246|nr:GLPGLI family protein [Hydrotalea lipotrueae]NIM35855.1 GLPGLI family protein [Hydrotalea flava]NIM38707.1 GLPGLI family protein [Hydrotalea flava]NIN03895.1 GLPGLI family protein [Hydrotalea flava]NIN15616.1 GLPGLI family protein [Hydrotalea flava]NIO94633.1 GLPGLI family protein [Hydrotalea flava]